FSGLGRTALSNSATASISLDLDDEEHIFKLTNVIPVTDNASFQVLASTDDGATFTVSISGHRRHSVTTSTTTAAISATTSGAICIVNVGSSTDEYGVTGEAVFVQPPGGYGRMRFSGGYTDTSARHVILDYAIQMYTTSPVTDIRFAFSSGDIES